MRPLNVATKRGGWRSSSVQLMEDFFMSKTTQFKAPTDAAARVHRREFLCLAPSAALASSIPLGVTLPRLSGNQVSIREALAALWDHSGEGSGSIIKPSTAERLDSFISGCNVGLISASRSDLTMEVNQRRCVGLWSDIWPRFGSIRRRCPL